MVGTSIIREVEKTIKKYESSELANLVDEAGGPYAIKFVKSRWAVDYIKPSRLKISDTPALTWGTATYVTPLAFPLSSALYGRIGLVTDFDPQGWRVFDATNPAAQMAYIRWVQAQPTFPDLVMTVHSTQANHFLRNKFREAFGIDCVLFNPDQEAELHTDRGRHIWMAVTDWIAGVPSRDAQIDPSRRIDSHMSARLRNARFTVLLDEDFVLEESGLPIRRAERQIEKATEVILNKECIEIGFARGDATLPARVIRHYVNGGYLHLFIEP
jgi:hypothetical protein